ncbi:hypothetical protein [Cupriavidus basilensis]|uniref:Uncharacterized protein n=1 Tax=Cupriavidus basilensis TaxID=68895 RepID=A0A0C4Y8S2_9BURK|nr:hypothetical protein [Cupriavidus basilensis]AJG19380.1 hypothetical protein RR42_m1985 [Cupriavidus basilensis]
MKIELRGDIWERLFPHAFTLMDEVRTHGGIEPFWTFGGRTVLIEAGPPIMREQFARIQRIGFDRSFDECVALARDFLNSLRETNNAPRRARERQRP